MSVPLPANLTCEIYRSGGGLSAAGVPCVLQAGDYRRRREQGDEAEGFAYSHIMLLAEDVDIRDGFDDWTVNAANRDFVLVPDIATASFAAYDVAFVELVARGTAGVHKRAYLNRALIPTWPSQYV